MFSVHIKSQDSVKLDQAVIRFVDTQSGIGSFVEAKQNERDSSKYTFSLKNSPAVRRKAGLYGSVYEVELLAAGSSVSNPIRWAFGSVEFRGTVQRQEEKPKFQHPFPFPQKDATTKGWYDALPAIEHQFRPQAPRPHTAFAYMFTLASFGPLAVLVLGLLLLRPDFRLFPSGFDGLLALGFHGLIAVCVLAVFGFWISVPFFDLLKILSVLGVPMLFIGGRTLRAVAAKSEVA
jgi:oligosaccharyltransferase complex subunit delta (ribophorin II)